MDFVWPDLGAGCEAHFFRAAIQFCTIVIGDVTASSAAMFNKNRPSDSTAYWALAIKPVGMAFPPLERRVEKSATGAPASSAFDAKRIGAAMRRASGVT